METMVQEKQELSPKQEAVLKALAVSAVPPVPPLNPKLLKGLPFWMRWAPFVKALSVSVLLGSVALLFHPVIPEVLEGPIPLKNGSSLELLAGKTWRIPLPSAKGWMVLDGPASLELVRAGRALLSGRFEAEIVLNRGDLFIQVHSDAPKMIQIRTPLCVVRVTGTEMLIGHQPGQGSRLLVMRGAVEMKTVSSDEWEPLDTNVLLRIDPQGRISREFVQEKMQFPKLDPTMRSDSSSSAQDSEKEEKLPELWNMIWHDNG